MSRGGSFGGFSERLFPESLACIGSCSLADATRPVSANEPEAPKPELPELPPAVL